MKPFQYTSLLAILLCLSVGLVGCKKKPTGVTVLPNRPAGWTGDNAGGDGSGNAISGMDSADGIPLGDPGAFDRATADREAFAANTVYFGFDSSLVQSSEQYKVSDVASALNQNLSNLLRIEGHCDERGTEGYNLALGERRALSLREALVAAGVDAQRIQTVSYGEERPADPGHDETAWSANRRGEFILLVP